MDEAGVHGARYEDIGEESQGKATSVYYRVLKSLDIATNEHMVQNILKDVFQNLAMQVIVESEPIKDSVVEEFIGDLRMLPNLHFK